MSAPDEPELEEASDLEEAPEPGSPITHSLVKALKGVGDFASLDDRTLLRVVGASVNLFWKAGSAVFERGDPSEALYVILSGEIRIFDPDGGTEVEVSRIGPGQSFGELSLLLRTKHTKTAETLEDTELMVLPAGSFEQLLSENADLEALFQRRLEERVPVRGDASDSA